MTVRVLGLVPARGGSRRVARKNLAVVGGKTLVRRALETAIASECFALVALSSDDPEILAQAEGLDVVVLERPGELATDEALVYDAVMHALQTLEADHGTFDAVGIAQCTSPFTVGEDLRGAVELLDRTGAESVVTVSRVEAKEHPQKLKRLDGDRLLPYLDDDRMAPSQLLPPLWARNGSLYLTRTDVLRRGALVGDDIRAYEMPVERSFDIDTERDLALAECLAGVRSTGTIEAQPEADPPEPAVLSNEWADFEAKSLERQVFSAEAAQPGGSQTFARTGRTDMRFILAGRLRDIVPVEQPLVLITQMPRSGGTLLMRLFDGHPEVHAIPHELGPLLRPSRRLVTGVDRAWKYLYDPKITEYLRHGYRQTSPWLNDDDAIYPFLLPQSVQRAIFEAALGRTSPTVPRDALNAYFTSYFNAWLDNRNLRGVAPKKWITAFSPNTVKGARVPKRFAQYYPDGRVISVVRDPWSWWASARRWSDRWHDREQAIAQWVEAAAAAREWKLTQPETVIVVPFVRLVRRTRRTMEIIARELGIEPRPELLTPTFNGLPVKANSSFPVLESGIITEPLERARGELDEADIAYIEEHAGEHYRRLLKLRVR